MRDIDSVLKMYTLNPWFSTSGPNRDQEYDLSVSKTVNVGILIRCIQIIAANGT